jgi:hypothetical protein
MDGSEILWRIGRAVGDQTDVLRCLLDVFPRPQDDKKVRFASFVPKFRVTAKGPPDLPKEWREALIVRADKIVANKLSYFDLEDQFHGDPVDWHKDWSSGVCAPIRPCTFVDYRKQKVFGDCKLVWEPNRHHQLVVLARAFAVTGSRTYGNKICELLEGWLDANPYGRGMNWKSPLEIGIRLINWVWAIDLIKDNYAIEDSLWARIQDAVYYSLWDIERKFSQGSSANNHLIGEAAGAFIAASYFHHLTDFGGLVAKSRQILEREIINQSYADGCTREHAFGYQAFVLQFFSLSSIVARKCGIPFTQQYNNRLSCMYEFLAEISQDTGAIPPFGDADDGYVLDLGDKPDNIGNLLSVGAQLFDMASLQFATPSETCAWLFGESQRSGSRRETTDVSRRFVESGYVILRSRPAGVAQPRVSILFDCADLGFGGIAAHGHADCLSFALAVNGVPIFVDPGTYDYFTHPDWRDYFRSTAAHNTVEIDGRSQSTSTGPFMWSARANPSLDSWRDDDEIVTAQGSHDGYSREDEAIIHTRELALNKTNGSINLRDRIECAGQHVAVRRFHLAPAFAAEIIDSSHIQLSDGKIDLILEHSAAHFEIVNASQDSKEGWVSTGYHRKTPSSCIRLRDSVSGPAELSLEIVQA